MGKKGLLGFSCQKRITFLTYGRNGVATYGEKGSVLGFASRLFAARIAKQMCLCHCQCARWCSLQQ